MGGADLTLVQHKLELQNLLKETVTQLCCKSIPFREQLSVEGLLGITVDSENVILVNLKQLVQNNNHDMGNSSNLYGTENYSSPVTSLINRSSGNRRKRKITRKAIVNVEDSYMDEEDEDLDSYFHDRDQMVRYDKYDADINSNVALNLVKRESPGNGLSPTSLDLSVKQELVSPTEQENSAGLDLSDIPDLKEPLENFDPSPVSNTLTLPNSADCQMRRYGAYGYIIQEGNKIMYSCNKCPKLFRNRVSLWRHGVKHKQCLDIQSSANPTNPPPFTSPWSCGFCNIVFGNEELLKGHIQIKHMHNSSIPATISSSSPSSLSSSQNGKLLSTTVHQRSSDTKRDPQRLLVDQMAVSQRKFPLHEHDRFEEPVFSWRQKTNPSMTKTTAIDVSNQQRPSLSSATNGERAEDSEYEDISDQASTQAVSNSGDQILHSSYHSDESNHGTNIPTAGKAQDLNSPLKNDSIKDPDKPAINLSQMSDQDHAERIISEGKILKTAPRSSTTRVRYRQTRGMPPPTSRPIGSYGTVFSTEEGKVFVCNQCQKSFKNRVSLWKHQFKHTEAGGMPK